MPQNSLIEPHISPFEAQHSCISPYEAQNSLIWAPVPWINIYLVVSTRDPPIFPPIFSILNFILNITDNNPILRRTLVVLNLPKEMSAQDVMSYFGTGAGEVRLHVLYDCSISCAGEVLPVVWQGRAGDRGGGGEECHARVHRLWGYHPGHEAQQYRPGG